MKKALFTLIMAFSVLLTMPALADKFENGIYAETGRTIELGSLPDDSKTTFEGTMTLAGNNVVVTDYVIDGDLTIFGNNAIIKNTTVLGNIYVAGNIISLDNVVAKDVFATGNQVWFDGGQTRDISAACQEFILAGTSAGALNVVSAGVNISGVFDDNIKINCQRLVIGAGTSIEKSIEYTSYNEAAIDETATISEIIKKEPYQASKSEIFKDFLLSFFTMFLPLLVAFIIIKFFGHCSEEKLTLEKKDYWLLPAISCLASIIIPLLIFGLIISSIGVPVFIALAAFVAILGIFSTYVGVILFSNTIAKRMQLKNPINNFIYVLYFFLVFGILSLLPNIGWIFIAYAFFVGFGWILRNIFSIRTN